MAQADDAAITISAFEWVPDFARGQVRDLVARWALEEAEIPYRVHLIHAGAPRPADYLHWQPFDQVPALRDATGEMFESGAILHYLGEKDARLLPTDPAVKMQAMSWLFATLSSVEPVLRPITLMPLFNGDKDWCAPAVASMMQQAERRLEQLSAALGDKEWLAGQFSVADIMMAFVLRSFGGQLINDCSNLLAYRARALARPAFARALQAQLDDLTGEPPHGHV
ncbi:glutathione S-transferase family protein [Alteraurantiacibacter aquimixticola]|uniref:Glutathione S-transferase family protein n=1 Tax=Alteraurantiacibacter aquimixticola TaxID=2489173 RepID=A0A4T3F5L3_9SPHN|nr:glutathione S-transferase family protein [Alteraurantiacibacter aquimixticola]TIX51769.1 glutathione S-transferase family protein [Alteraurantiacibacter aquimixticola]